MQEGARADTAKITLEMLKDKKQLRLLELRHWPPNSPGLSPVDFGIWGLLEQNLYQGQRMTDFDSLKETIVEEWNKIPQEIIEKCTDAFRPRLRRVIEVEGWHIKRY